MRDGYERTSTNKIAQVAGVSIGSLYQYFPSKEALVAAVIDRHQSELRDVARGALAEVGGQSLARGIRTLVEVALDAHRIDPRLHKVLAEQIPRMGRLKNVAAFEQEAAALLGAYLKAHRGELAVADVDLAAFVCVTSVEALTHAAVVDRARPLTDDEAEQLVEHGTRLVLRYLCD